MAENWIKLYEMVNGMKCSRAEDDRKFKAFAGCAPEVAEYIFLKYSDGVNFKDRWNLLIVLYYLKNNPTEDEGARVFQIGSRNTYRKYLWDLIYYLDFKMNEIDIESRFDGPIAESGIFANVTLVVDGTDCPIYRPTEKSDRLLYSSGRKKENTYSKYNIKYTIGVQVGNGRICCVLGPEPGSVSDITAIRNGEIIATITSWDPFEVVLADKGYQGLDSCLSPIKGPDRTPEEDAFNEVLASVRQIVECVLHRIKIFGVLGGKGRFACCKKKAQMCVQSLLSNIKYFYGKSACLAEP